MPTPTCPGQGRVALVTGASGGIGRDLCVLLAEGGFDLRLVARSETPLRELAESLARDHGIRAEAIPVDLADPAAPASLAERALRLGPVDVLVNNAGFGVYGPFAEADLPAQLGLIQVNIVALTALTRLFLPGMIQRGWGRILHVASVAAFVPGPYLNTYYASKAYVVSHALALSRELRGTGVTVSALCPGPTRTGFQQRAGMADAKLFRMGTMDSMPVARAGYEGMLRGKRLVVPGLLNKLNVLAARLAPRSWAASVAARLNRPS